MKIYIEQRRLACLFVDEMCVPDLVVKGRHEKLNCMICTARACILYSILNDYVGHLIGRNHSAPFRRDVGGPISVVESRFDRVFDGVCGRLMLCRVSKKHG